MGATLFVRGNRGRALELTHEGQLLYRRAREIVELADRTKSEIASGKQIEGNVHIAAAQAQAMDILAEAAVQFASCIRESICNCMTISERTSSND